MKLQKIFATANLLEKDNSNVSYLNLFQDSRFVNDDFYDADHLNNEGAKKCSIITNQYIQNTVIN